MPSDPGDSPDSDACALDYRLDLTSVGQIRRSLWRNGFRPVPLYNWDDPTIEERSRGKRPWGDDWQNLAAEDPPVAVRHPVHPRARNTGILTAELCGVDIDVPDPHKVQALFDGAEDWLGRTIFRIRENAAKIMLLYVAADNLYKQIHVGADPAEKVELLGIGQQFAAHGLHPSGVWLAWPDGAPWNTPRSQLPKITAEQIAEFRQHCATVIGTAPPRHATVAQRRHSHDLEFTIDDIIAMLEVIDGQDDYDHWVAIGMAVFVASDGSSDGYAAWCEWSAHSTKYSEHACRSKWRNFCANRPNRIGGGKLLALALHADPNFITPSLAARLDPHGPLRDKLRTWRANGAPRAPDPLRHFERQSQRRQCRIARALENFNPKEII